MFLNKFYMEKLKEEFCDQIYDKYEEINFNTNLVSSDYGDLILDYEIFNLKTYKSRAIKLENQSFKLELFFVISSDNEIIEFDLVIQHDIDKESEYTIHYPMLNLAEINIFPKKEFDFHKVSREKLEMLKEMSLLYKRSIKQFPTKELKLVLNEIKRIRIKSVEPQYSLIQISKK